MSRTMKSLGTMMLAVLVFALAPMAMAQDMTGEAQTDPPAPVADGFATFTGTYENLGPGPAADIFVNVDFSIQPDIWPPESDGFNAVLESTDGTDTNGNDVFWGFESERMCSHYRLQLQMPNDTGDQPMIPNPLPAGGSGSFSWQLPVIPMEGVSAGRLVITEPERLRNTYGMTGDSYLTVGGKPWENVTYQQTGLYNLVAQALGCEDGSDGCLDLDACIGNRLWQTEAFEADLVIVEDGSDLNEACGTITNAAELAGKIALIRRGDCFFIDKITNVQDTGAAGMIMVNNGLCSDDPDADPEECTITVGQETRIRLHREHADRDDEPPPGRGADRGG